MHTNAMCLSADRFPRKWVAKFELRENCLKILKSLKYQIGNTGKKHGRTRVISVTDKSLVNAFFLDSYK